MGATLAQLAGPVVRRVDGGEPVLATLPDLVHVSDSPDSPERCDTLVTFDDELAAWCDAYDDGLDLALADQPGIAHVLAEDREVVHLRTRLALEDVRAAVVRAVVEVNRRPQERPRGATQVADEQARALADAVAPLLVDAGSVRHGGDGTRLDDRVELWSGALVQDVLPWLDGTRGRAALARWVAEDPSRVRPPVDQPPFARLLAEWAHRDAARALLRQLEVPGLGLRDHPDAVATRQVVGEG